MHSDELCFPSAKRQREIEDAEGSLAHSVWLKKSEVVECKDFLKILYPHDRDNDCYLDEITHTYYVHKSRYNCSVSSVWKVFFGEFDAAQKSMKLLQCAEKDGIRNIHSSLYNLYVYILMEKKIPPESSVFFTLVESSIKKGIEFYRRMGWDCDQVDEKESVNLMRQLIISGCQKPQNCPTCYFLSMLAGCTPTDLCRVWELNGNIESFKGTVFHKRAELYMQELAAWQLEQGRQHVTLREMLSIPALKSRARAASSPGTALVHLAPHIASSLWDHPATQSYLTSFLSNADNPEFQQLEQWMNANPSLSPFRSEWSIFDEDCKVAGQVDSLWFDEDFDSQVIMADWKRAREILSSSPTLQRKQSFGAKALKCSQFVPDCPNPCVDMYDCAYNHYLVQQHLYSDFLMRKYNVNVKKMFLVQCHPNLDDYNEAELEVRPHLARRVLHAFTSGWNKHLRTSISS